MKKEKIHWTKLDPEKRMKYEIAEELGILDNVLTLGWENLSARETGKIGGLVAKRRKLEKTEK